MHKIKNETDHDQYNTYAPGYRPIVYFVMKYISFTKPP